MLGSNLLVSNKYFFQCSTLRVSTCDKIQIGNRFSMGLKYSKIRMQGKVFSTERSLKLILGESSIRKICKIFALCSEKKSKFNFLLFSHQ